MSPALSNPKNQPRKGWVNIGTRGSLLALAQARQVLRLLKARHPKRRFRIVIVKTTGDEFQSVALFKKNNIGVFTKKIERLLLSGKIDIAVHSLKDLPTQIPRGLRLAACLKRLDTADALISLKRWSLSELPAGAIVGTGSPRRKRQILRLRPDLELRDMRGNLDTRVGKVIREKRFDAIVVANAGLLRIKKYRRFARPISPLEVLPAVGQAAIAVQTRARDKETRGMAAALNHGDTEKEVTAERRLLQTLRGGCRVPVGVYAKVLGARLRMKAAVFSVKNTEAVIAEVTGPASRAAQLGERLAKELLRRGAGKFLKEAKGGKS